MKFKKILKPTKIYTQHYKNPRVISSLIQFSKPTTETSYIFRGQYNILTN